MTRAPRPKWPAIPGSLQERLLAILEMGGPRKVLIMKAWAVAAGFTQGDLFGVAYRLQAHGRLFELSRPGPLNEDSGPYWSTSGAQFGNAGTDGSRA